MRPTPRRALLVLVTLTLLGWIILSVLVDGLIQLMSHLIH